ncbi:hypothetical protein U91I_03264 [alpha proteobacterium U9-1i]|nr:hypothetical protein U91I_03264 [alpha proteobacterium U9-1i]
MRTAFAVLALITAACTPPAEAPSINAEIAENEDAAILSALTPVLTAEIGAPLRLEITQLNVQDEWAWIAVQPLQPDGAAIVWSTTALADRYENGAMDESGAAYALLKLENGAWRIVTHVIAPTDVAWLSWPADYGAPASLMGVGE